MSPEVIAALLGVVVGVLAERVARWLGRVRCEASMSSLMLTDITDERGRQTSVPLAEADANTLAERAFYVAAIDFFNGREVPTGLRDVRIELIREDSEALVSHPDDPSTGRPSQWRVASQPSHTIYDTLDVVNLPPRQFTRLELHGKFGGDGAVALRDRRWRKIEFVGEFPGPPILGVLGSKTYRKTITEPKDWQRR